MRTCDRGRCAVQHHGRASARTGRGIELSGDDGIEVTFRQVDGFRLLDEASLAEYWIAEDFPSSYPVLAVFEDGWAKEEGARLCYAKQ